MSRGASRGFFCWLVISSRSTELLEPHLANGAGHGVPNWKEKMEQQEFAICLWKPNRSPSVPGDGNTCWRGVLA
eukprot:scaffold78880_cov64-Phaeocystis_antarctica.AAC.2